MSERTYNSLVEIVRQDHWGDGGLIEPEDWEPWFQLSNLDKARYIGARTGCPIVETLAVHPNYGPEYQIKRYGNVNFWYRFLKNQMGVSKKFGSFGAPIDIKVLGGMGKHDPEWVPNNRKSVIKGPETYHAYVLPRQILDIIKLSHKLSDVHSETGEKTEFSAEQVDLASRQAFLAIDSILTSPNLDAAVLRLALQSKRLMATGTEIRKRVFDKGYRKELPENYWGPIFERIRNLLESKKI